MLAVGCSRCRLVRKCRGAEARLWCCLFMLGDWVDGPKEEDGRTMAKSRTGNEGIQHLNKQQSCGKCCAAMESKKLIDESKEAKHFVTAY